VSDAQIVTKSEIPEQIDLKGEIRLFPDPILNTPCDPVPFPMPDKVKVEVFDFVKRMMAHCTVRKGLGLAANQLGETFRIFIMQMPEHEFLVCFNPEIVKTGREEVLVKEGCLSHPGFQVPKKRKTIITLKYRDFDGRPYENVFKRKEAFVIQHEMDHLLGIPFLPEDPKKDDTQRGDTPPVGQSSLLHARPEAPGAH
jgi:peptide deformylase